MESNVTMSILVEDFLEHLPGTEPAAEDLRQALNDIIARYKIHPSVVISLLARISAGYIHITQKLYNRQNAAVVVEEDFQDFLTAHLTSLDMNDVAGEIEKIKKEKLN